MQKWPVIVAEARWVAREVKLLRLTSADGRPFPPVAPGAHVDVWLPTGSARQYSVIERSQDAASYTIAVLREPASRGGSIHLVDEVESGHALEIGEPRNHFALNEEADEYILIAGGIGITPLISMARRLTVLGKAFSLHYLNRSRERAAFLDLLQAPPFSPHLSLHFDDEHGRPDLGAAIGPSRPGAQIYVCGPSGLIDATLDTARSWSPDAVRFERFNNASPATPNAEGANAEGPDAGGGFEVELARSGRTIAVAAGESILDALHREGVAVEAVCREGTCGSCMLPMLGGEAEHRDSIQSPAEQKANTFICVCVSRAISPRIVLDL